MFGINKKKLYNLEEHIRLLQNWNTRSSSEVEYLAKRVTMLENPAKYSIGYELKKRYIITGRKWDKTNYAIASSGGMYHCMEGWRYDVFDREENKPTTLWEDQIDKFIEGNAIN
jgi:hypothetical protein